MALLALVGCGPDETLEPADIEIAYVRRHYVVSQLRGFSPGKADIALLPPDDQYVFLHSLCWSPDGSLLAFVRNPEDYHELHLFDPESGEARMLATGHSPAWSPVGLSLGYLRREGASWSLHVFDTETEEDRRIGTGTVNEFSWAPDGRRVVVIGTWPELDTNRALYVLDVETGDVTRIDPDPPNADGYPPIDSDPTWSPDGSTIAFTSTRAESQEVSTQLHRIDPDGTNLEQLSGTGYGNVPLSWSPTGDVLAYKYWVFDAVSLDDRGVVLLGGGQSFRGVNELAWSPDGSAVIFPEPHGHTPNGAVHTRLRMVALDGSIDWPVPESERPWADSNPAWRPPR